MQELIDYLTGAYFMLQAEKLELFERSGYGERIEEFDSTRDHCIGLITGLIKIIKDGYPNFMEIYPKLLKKIDEFISKMDDNKSFLVQKPSNLMIHASSILLEVIKNAEREDNAFDDKKILIECISKFREMILSIINNSYKQFYEIVIEMKKYLELNIKVDSIKK